VPINSLNVRLSGFYLFYFATLGVLLPYWSLYLQSLGFTAARIGELTAIMLATKVVAPNVWGWLADKTEKRITIVKFACFATVVCFAPVYSVGSSLLGLALIMLCFSFFWNAALPQFESITLNHLGDNAHRYSQVRLWGSIGFIIATLTAGLLVQRWGIDTVPAVLLGLFIALWVNSLTIPQDTKKPTSLLQTPLTWVLRQPAVIALLLVCFLNQASHGPYYAFFSIYLEELDYSQSVIGSLWSLGVAAEVVMFLLMSRLLPHWGPRKLMLTASILASLRWALISIFAVHPIILVFAQLLHGFSFGVYHAVAIYLIHCFFTGKHQGRGQALYSSLSFGAGGALGSLTGGYVWEHLGGSVTYMLAAGISFIGFLIAWFGLRVRI
jgi:PPP family 3-phenylpropionic acid transporter